MNGFYTGLSLPESLITVLKKCKFWQETNHAVLLDTKEMIDQRINYTHENPVRAIIVAVPHNYLFCSARGFAVEKGYVNEQTEI